MDPDKLGQVPCSATVQIGGNVTQSSLRLEGISGRPYNGEP